MGGVKNVWKASQKRLGLQLNNVEKEKESEVFNDLLTCEQNLSDGKLECYTYETGAHLGCERIFKGNARRIFQGAGPIYIKFKDTPVLSPNDTYHRIYFNADGEYFNIVKPLSMKIRRNKNFLDGKVKFLSRIEL